MPHSPPQLRRDALQIWRAGVDAVLPVKLIPKWLRVEGQSLVVGDETIPLDTIRRIVVVGAGKAGAAMAVAVESAIGPETAVEKHLEGWVNVPADCTGALRRIHLHAARPAGVNEPTPEGVAGSMEILRLVESLGPNDLCLCLISGGGSALMPAPVEGVSLADKLAVTRHLSAAGANIEQLNVVRKQISRIKGGGLLRACRAGRIISLIISDVLGDPLDLIASGPTVQDSSTPQAALDVLEQFGVLASGIAPSVVEYLEKYRNKIANNSRGPTARGAVQNNSRGPTARGETPCVVNLVIGNNATAVAAAAEEAKRLGYAVATEIATCSEGPAEPIGRALAERAMEMRNLAAPACFISGGEPVVRLVKSSLRGRGGRNQQLTLAALARLFDNGAKGITLLSGGTDGEDGPTDAAGAFLDAEVLTAARRGGLDPADYLARNDAYRFFDPLDALIRTGPTGTNVCDVRVVVIRA